MLDVGADARRSARTGAAGPPPSDLCRLIWCALIRLFRPRAALEAEIVVLRHQPERLIEQTTP
jgi:hypothetical protein